MGTLSLARIVIKEVGKPKRFLKLRKAVKMLARKVKGAGKAVASRYSFEATLDKQGKRAYLDLAKTVKEMAKKRGYKDINKAPQSFKREVIEKTRKGLGSLFDPTIDNESKKLGFHYKRILQYSVIKSLKGTKPYNAAKKTYPFIKAGADATVAGIGYMVGSKVYKAVKKRKGAKRGSSEWKRKISRALKGKKKNRKG